VLATRVPVAATATLIASNVRAEEADWATRSFLVKNLTGTAAVFLNGANTVTAATPAFQWDVADGPLAFDLEPGEELYGIVAVTTQTVHVLRQGR
jgi:hypothetical protein